MKDKIIGLIDRKINIVINILKNKNIFNSIHYTLYTIIKNKYEQSFTILESLYKTGEQIYKDLQEYNLLYNDKKINKILKLYTNQFNIISNTLYIIRKNGKLSKEETVNLFKACNRITKILIIAEKYFPKPKNTVFKYITIGLIIFLLGIFCEKINIQLETNNNLKNTEIIDTTKIDTSFVFDTLYNDISIFYGSDFIIKSYHTNGVSSIIESTFIDNDNCNYGKQYYYLSSNGYFIAVTENFKQWLCINNTLNIFQNDGIKETTTIHTNNPVACENIKANIK